MAGKIKILQKDIPVLGKNVEIESDVLQKIIDLQAARFKQIQDRIDAANKDTLAKYEIRLTALKEAKAKAMKKYDDEINNLQNLIKNLKVTNNPVKTSRKKSNKK